jgi:hypothetical protein
MIQGGIIHHKPFIDLLVGYKYLCLPYIPLTKMWEAESIKNDLTKHWSTIHTTICSFVFALSCLNFINNVVLTLDLVLSKRRVMLLLRMYNLLWNLDWKYLMCCRTSLSSG